MLGILKPRRFVVLAFISGLVSALTAQAASQPALTVQTASQPSAPTESNNPRVFISNVGSDPDQILSQGASVTGGPGQAYNKFYAAVQNSGQYQLVGFPAEADFVFEIRFTEPYEVVHKWGDQEADPFKKDRAHQDHRIGEFRVYYPKIRLVILDPRTHAVLGVFTEQIEIGNTQRERDARFAYAIKLLVGYAGNLLDRFPTSADVPSLVSDAPTPPQITSAKTVFVSNASSSVAAYNLLYAMMENWGGYRLTAGTSEADLILQVSDNPRLRVAILDPQTGVTLWGYTPDLEPTILKRNSRKDLDRGLAAIVHNIARINGQAVPADSTPQSAKGAATPPNAPIPPQLSGAKTVFISNAGGEPLSDWKGRPLQPYNAFYATMKSWARLKLVSTPADADLVCQVSVVRSEPLFLRLTILDSRTQAALWELNQDIRSDQTIHGSFAEQKDLDRANAALVNSLAKLAGQPDAHISVAPDTQTAPPPSRISDFRKVFISRPREKDGFFGEDAPDQLYDTLEADLRSWGRYQFTTPRDADLIFEPSASDTRVRLTIRDAKTRHVLWTFVRPVKTVFFNENASGNYEAAIGLLVDDLRRMASASTPLPHASI
jgi:hypothetical protein